MRDRTRFEAVEVVVGVGGDDTLGGDGAANLFAGMRGDDKIADGGGADTLSGGRGDDIAARRARAEPA